MECPKCGYTNLDQDHECKNCGIIIEKYIRQKIAKNCPYCAELVLNNAIKCKHCGEFFEKEEITDSAETKEGVVLLLKSLGDFSLSRRITPQLIKIAYGLGIIFLAVGAIVSSSILAYNGCWLIALLTVVGCLLSIIGLRIAVELILTLSGHQYPPPS